eukprot:SAG31_NODE_294_length_18242_cov_28.418949_18_plen_81_part_00
MLLSCLPCVIALHRLLLEENLATSHGRKAMLKYIIILANSAVACERFTRNGEGLKVLAGVLENHIKDGKECLVLLIDALL